MISATAPRPGPSLWGGIGVRMFRGGCCPVFGGMRVQDEEPSAAALVEESYVVVDATGFDDLTTVASHQAVGSVADAQALACGDPQISLVAWRSCTQELEVMTYAEEWSILWRDAQKRVLNPRRALAQHFTSARQPQKQQGPAMSLNLSLIHI